VRVRAARGLRSWSDERDTRPAYAGRVAIAAEAVDQKLAFKPTVTIPPFACFDSLPK
jgi:hypothetical protein